MQSTSRQSKATSKKTKAQRINSAPLKSLSQESWLCRSMRGRPLPGVSDSQITFELKPFLSSKSGFQFGYIEAVSPGV